MPERVQKLIAACGVCSRRKAEDLIKAGKVTLNGKVATIGQSADFSKDVILVNGRKLTKPSLLYFAVNKPLGYECTLKSVGGKPLVTSLVKSKDRLYPAGRLDANSRGLVILTNDGELAHRIMHPSHPLIKVYQVAIDRSITNIHLSLLAKGVKLDDGYKTRRCKVERVISQDGRTILRIELGEGKKRQVRRMIAAIGRSVTNLVRIEIGPVKMGDLKKGASRPLTSNEIKELKAVLRLP